MLYSLAQRGNFFTTWLALSVLAYLLMLVMSGTLFYRYYARPTFETWQRKSNPEFPDPTMVRREVLQMLKGIYTATFCPALALHLVNAGWSKAYGGLGGTASGTWCRRSSSSGSDRTSTSSPTTAWATPSGSGGSSTRGITSSSTRRPSQ
jgi:hypothetical protein